MRWVHRMVSLAALAFIGAAAQWAAGAAPTEAVPFSVGKDTTAIVAPLRADGTVDYVMALNEKYGRGVMPENNGFVLWLQLVGTGDAVVPPKAKVQFLKACGAKETPAGADVWDDYAASMKRRLGLSDEQLDPQDRAAVEAYDNKVMAIHEELSGAARRLWRAEDHADVAAFIQGREKLLALAAQAADRPRWWVPVVPRDGRSLSSAWGDSPRVSEVAQTLCARAMLRATAGDMDGFLKDIRTVRQLARHVGGGPHDLDRMTGESMENQATGAMAGWAATGTLTEAQCQALAAALAGLGPMPSMLESVDCMERWRLLDTVQWASVAGMTSDPMEVEVIGRGKEQIPSGYSGKIDHAEVDWNAVLKRVNAAVDDNIKAMGMDSMKDLRAASDAIERQLDELNSQGYGRGLALSMAAASVTRPAPTDKPLDLSKGAAETRAAYTDRVTKILLVAMRPSYGVAEEIHRRCTQQRAMVRVVLAAAEVKARMGKWPGRLEELAPSVLKELPRDIYSKDGASPFHYVVKAEGVRVYSVGPNGRDDGGVRDGKQKDDLAVGVP